jgi:hypothetical protein
MKKLVLFLILLSLCLMIYPSISGAIDFEGIGGKLAIVLPDGRNNTIGFGVIGSLGSILPQMMALKAETSAEYWGNSNTFGASTRSFSNISFNGTAKYHFSSGGMSPFAGGGLGLVFSRYSWWS